MIVRRFCTIYFMISVSKSIFWSKPDVYIMLFVGGNAMWTISEVKEQGKAAFRTNYWNCVIVSIIMSIVTGGSLVGGRSAASGSGVAELKEYFADMDPALIPFIIMTVMSVFVFAMIIGILIKIFVFNPLKVGCYTFFRKNINGDGELGNVVSGFHDFGRTFITLFLTDLFLSLWSMLFIIPGIIKSYSYRLVPYIIADNPELSSTEVITRSRELMNGHKFKAFLLDFSFIGWIILAICTCGIASLFWVSPYISSTNAALYLKLKQEYSSIDNEYREF